MADLKKMVDDWSRGNTPNLHRIKNDLTDLLEELAAEIEANKKEIEKLKAERSR